MNSLAAFSTDLHRLRDGLQLTAQAPADAPQGLAGAYYTDPDLFAHERATMLRAGWHCVGRTDELPQNGAYRAFDLLGEPVLLVRDQGKIRALANVCKHRGMPLAQGEGQAKRFTCRYHAWTYGTDGGLLRAPRMDNAGFDPSTCRLGQYPCEERYGFVYVCPSHTAPPLAPALEGLDSLIGAYEPERYRLVHSAQETWDCNWKALVENFMEGYHLSVVHPQTLHGYTPTGLSRKGPNGPGFTSYFANYPSDITPRGQGAPGLDPAARHRSTLFAVYPCQVVSIAATLLVSLSILPRAADRIDVRWTLSTYGDELDDETLAARIALWEDVNREDREKLEAMQGALGSIHATGGPLAGPDYEGTVHDFLLWYARMDREGV
ncbi:MAG: aromatic ring-hydroxylating dioxygenase subunit alpha [Pseudomonadota bacterium]